MIPFSDQPGTPRRSTPVVMIALVLVNVAVFLYELSLGNTLSSVIQAYGLVPYEIVTGRDIPPTIPFPVYITLITSMFLHGGFLHIGGNMLFLWVFGDNVEDSIGHFNFLLFYFICGIVAGLSQVAIDPLSQVPGIGASGAIAGVLAAYLVLFPRAVVRILLFIGPFFTVTRLSAFIVIGFWIVLQIVSGLFIFNLTAQQTSGVAYWAHIGGFFAGLILIWLYREWDKSRVRQSDNLG